MTSSVETHASVNHNRVSRLVIVPSLCHHCAIKYAIITQFRCMVVVIERVWFWVCSQCWGVIFYTKVNCHHCHQLNPSPYGHKIKKIKILFGHVQMDLELVDGNDGNSNILHSKKHNTVISLSKLDLGRNHQLAHVLAWWQVWWHVDGNDGNIQSCNTHSTLSPL